jgi:hypothetical protein
MDHPIRLVVNDDLQRSRLTVFFRLLLVIPHVLVVLLWAIAASFAVIINWFATLFSGRSPEGIHGFLAGFLRYSTQVSAYYHLLANPFPPFLGGDYPIDLEIAPPEQQNRLTVFFRGILVIPAYILWYVLNSVLSVITFFAWFVCLVLGRMPEGLRNLGAYVVKYQAQTLGYWMLLTPHYPSLSFGGTEASAATTT